MATLATLPEDITMDILSKSSVKSISRFRCVCKHWYEFLKNPMFVKMHQQHAMEKNKFSVLLEDGDGYYIIDFDVTSSSYRMSVQTDVPPTFDTFTYDDPLLDIGSYDGVICGSLHFRDKICLWNPSTREYKYINHNESYNKNSFSRYGVCYDWKIDDYKLFLIVAANGDDGCSEVWVSRLGSNSWNIIVDIPYDISGINVSVKPLNGIIHGVVNTEVIISVDIVEERTKEFQIPSCYLDEEPWKSYDYMEVGVLGEELYLLVNPRYKPNIDLWVMKDYGVIDSWTKIFTISEYETMFEKLIPVQYLSKNGEILLKGERSKDKDSLVSYDPKTARLVTLDIPCMPYYFRATTFVGSLVSLNSGEFVKDSERVNLVFDPLLLRKYYRA